MGESVNNNNSKFQFNNLTLLSIAALVGLSKLVKFSFIVGSARAFFSLINVAGPLTIAFNGLPGGVFFLVLTSLFNAKAVLLSGLLGSSGLPNFIAGLYLRSHNGLFKIVVPSVCMLLFWYQTWGTIAMAYALLWIIPIVISLLKTEQIYFKSLAATFVAHSIGSVIWVYGANLTAEQWFALIPVALAERIVLAILIGFVYNLAQANFTKKLFCYKNSLPVESAAV